ncbi:MAG: alpha/beta fold hydrolase, partial [Myxococcota bacterium]
MPRVERLRTTHTVTTEDGWELVVYRDRPRRLSTSVPVLLLHGLASTSECWYGGRGGGIGTSLAHAGRDVWAVELRGGPDSQPPGRRRAWRMSEKLHLDVPAVIDFVREQTGEDQIDAVGHSMGGILLTLHTLTRQRSAIRRLVTIGSPLTLEQRILPRLLRSRFGEGVARALGRVPLRALSSQFSAVLPARLLPTHFEPALAERTTVRGVYARQVADVFGQELSELVRWIAD